MGMLKILKRLTRNFCGLRHRVNYTTTTRDGKYNIPIFGGIGSGNIDDREHYVGAIIGKILERNEGVFLDVGANTGQTLLHFLRSGTHSKYIGFEVQDLCAAYIHKLIQANNCENAFIYPFGLSNKNSVVKILSRGDADAAATIDLNFRDKSFYQNETYGVTRIGDEVVKEIGLTKIALIKIDVEGCEADVIEGLMQTLSEIRPYIIAEVLPTGHVENSSIVEHRKTNMERIENVFDDLGYYAYHINPDCTIERVKGLDNKEFKLRFCNYLFSPTELRRDRQF